MVKMFEESIINIIKIRKQSFVNMKWSAETLNETGKKA